MPFWTTLNRELPKEHLKSDNLRQVLQYSTVLIKYSALCIFICSLRSKRSGMSRMRLDHANELFSHLGRAKNWVREIRLRKK